MLNFHFEVNTRVLGAKYSMENEILKFLACLKQGFPGGGALQNVMGELKSIHEGSMGSLKCC